MGLSAKGALFDDLFCRPSYVDEALTTEPGRRTPDQVSGTLDQAYAHISTAVVTRAGWR